MTDIPRGQGGDGSPQLDLNAIRARLTERRHDLTLGPDGKMAWAVGDITALLALVRRLQQENEELRFVLQNSDPLEEVALCGRVEELTEALRALLTEAFVGDVFTMEAQLLTAPELKARALLARVVPEKETP